MTRTDQLVITLTTSDRPGVVDQLAQVVRRHEGNWLDSSLARLAGHFAGVVLVSMPAAKKDSFRAALEALGSHGIEARCTGVAEDAGGGGALYQIELLGSDRPGIVGQLSEKLALRQVNVERLETSREPGSMSGAPLFRALARVRLPLELDADLLIADLEALAADLQVTVLPE